MVAPCQSKGVQTCFKHVVVVPAPDLLGERCSSDGPAVTRRRSRLWEASQGSEKGDSKSKECRAV